MTADFGQAKQQAESFADSIKAMNSAMKEAMESGDYSQAAQLTGAINNLVSAQRMSAVNSPQGNADMLAKVAIANQATQFLSSLTNTVNAGIGSITQLAQGHVSTAISSVYNTVSGMAMSGAGIAAASGNIPLAALLAVGGGVASIAGGLAEKDQQLADDYQENILKSNIAFERYYNFNDANKYTEKYARNTGLTRSELADLAINEAQYGLTDGKTALNRARETARYSYATGVDSSALQAFSGLASRYGLGDDALNRAYSSLNAAGLEIGQFGEYVSMIQKALEDGISKGFTKSTEEVVSNYIMLAELSNNNPLWVGEEGTRRLQTINSSVASATDLQSVSDVMVYNAYKNLGAEKLSDYLDKAYVKDGGYINYMLAMEKGVNLDVFKQLAEIIAGEGGYEAQIERVKQIFGLNYTGSTQILEMMKNAGDYDETSFQNAYTTVTQAPEANTPETVMQDAVNRLESYFDGWKENSFKVVVEKIEDVANITQSVQEFGQKIENAFKNNTPQTIQEYHMMYGSSTVGAGINQDYIEEAKEEFLQTSQGQAAQKLMSMNDTEAAQAAVALLQNGITESALNSDSMDKKSAGVAAFIAEQFRNPDSSIHADTLSKLGLKNNGNDIMDDIILRYLAQTVSSPGEIIDTVNSMYTPINGNSYNYEESRYDEFYKQWKGRGFKDDDDYKAWDQAVFDVTGKHISQQAATRKGDKDPESNFVESMANDLSKAITQAFQSLSLEAIISER